MLSILGMYISIASAVVSEKHYWHLVFFKAVIFQNFMFICNGDYVLTVTSVYTSHRAAPTCSLILVAQQNNLILLQSGKVPYKSYCTHN